MHVKHSHTAARTKKDVTRRLSAWMRMIKKRTHSIKQPADGAISAAAQHSKLGNVFIELQSTNIR